MPKHFGSQFWSSLQLGPLSHWPKTQLTSANIQLLSSVRKDRISIHSWLKRLFSHGCLSASHPSVTSGRTRLFAQWHRRQRLHVIASHWQQNDKHVVCGLSMQQPFWFFSSHCTMWMWIRGEKEIRRQVTSTTRDAVTTVSLVSVLPSSVNYPLSGMFVTSQTWWCQI